MNRGDFMADMESAHHSEQIKTNLKSRLNRIEGQVRAINRMIDDDVYCDDVLTQIRATRSALNSVATKSHERLYYGKNKRRCARRSNG